MNDKPYYELALLGFDIESTGINVKEDRIVSFNVTYDIPGQEMQKNDWVINPGIEIPKGASDVHGITTQYAQENGMEPKQALQSIHDHLANWESYGLPLVAFNASFDCSMLHYEWIRHGIDSKVTFSHVIDPFILDKKAFKFRKGKRTLTALSNFYMVELENAHSADADVEATLKIARQLPKALPAKSIKLDIPLSELQDKQKKWKKEQAEDLQKYLRSKVDSNAFVSTEWPVILGEIS